MEPTPKRLAELESHSAMLGQICAYVEDFASRDGMTTLDCVRLVVANYQKLLAEKEIAEIERGYFD